jgi:hypothetical protein
LSSLSVGKKNLWNLASCSFMDEEYSLVIGLLSTSFPEVLFLSS